MQRYRDIVDISTNKKEKYNESININNNKIHGRYVEMKKMYINYTLYIIIKTKYKSSLLKTRYSNSLFKIDKSNRSKNEQIQTK